MNANFVREIEYLLENIPVAQWEDPTICGVMYEFLPWHKMSSITIHTSEDDVHDPGGWKYYFSAESDGSRIRQEIELYQKAGGRVIYHNLLVQAAEALLSIDFTKYGQPQTIDDFCLYGPFQLHVYDADKTFCFNYCEYVLAARLDGRTKRGG